MAIIHMDTEQVNDQGGKLTYSATDILDLVDKLRYSARDLHLAWSSSKSVGFMQEFDKLVEALRSHALSLDGLGRSIIREVNQWTEVDRTESAYLVALKKNFNFSIDDTISVGAAVMLASSLRWSHLRPHSVIFTGPNWMRRAVGIKEMTRVIKPATMAKGTAVGGLIESGMEALETGIQDLTDPRYEDLSHAISAATVDAGFRFTISAIGKVIVIPLLLGWVAATVGLPVLTGGAIILGGSVILGLAYEKLAEAPLWEWWQQSTARGEMIETRARNLNSTSNFIQQLMGRAAERVSGAFNGFVQSMTTSASPALS